MQSIKGIPEKNHFRDNHHQNMFCKLQASMPNFGNLEESSSFNNEADND